MRRPLRYEISEWSQVSQCQSNSSKQLHLKYVNLMDKRLKGELIRVEHEKFGCLFAYIVSGSGPLLMESANGLVYSLEPNEILKELEKFGFYIQFSRTYNISNNQIAMLLSVQALNMDKIRMINVIPKKKRIGVDDPSSTKIVAFNIADNPNWLDNTYECSEDEFAESLINGSVLNLSAMYSIRNENWSFLQDKVLDVDSILEALDNEVYAC